MRNDQTYASVMSSPLMTNEMKQVYWVLWSPPEGLTKGEIEAACKAQNWTKNSSAPWDKMVSAMVKMGLVKKGNKRHCSVKNKEDFAWVLTDSATPSRVKAPRPSPKQFLKAVAQFEMVIAHHDSHGGNFITPELRKLYEWVRDKVPEK